ncbi:MAG TPA: hypothetical protein VLL08_11955 [Kineosporiaceae bacterium]|nr:hypothetical protein [Kineosporiaceae bacterium]
MTKPEAEALRVRLDLELARVHATAQARERLARTIAARARTPLGTIRPARRPRPAIALPLVGVLVATVIAAAVVIPATLRADSVPISPAGGTQPSFSQLSSPTPSSPKSTPASTPVSTLTPASVPRAGAGRKPEPASTAIRDEPRASTVVPARVGPAPRR